MHLLNQAAFCRRINIAVRLATSKTKRELGFIVKFEPCIYGKAHLLQVGREKKAEKAGKLISTDICRSFQKKQYLVVKSYNNFGYGFFIKETLEL